MGKGDNKEWKRGEGDHKGPHPSPPHPRPYYEYEDRVCIFQT